MKNAQLMCLFTFFFVSGCSFVSFPSVHKIPIQQGNIVEQEMINKLLPGMTKSQAQFVLGTPLIVDSFNQNQWTYFYSLTDDNSKQNKKILVLFFDDKDQLQRLTSDYETDGTGFD
ncbi:MAG: outer membrane protein assembly factor BamE [Cellvibrionales bacterium TMED148]|nr:hypothetical protein [Porticoccaceae bacterium]RPG89380.1 MAG: outer membrane protein assembly factor BamE [Cellvibrionales bacterium TMED148]|tara:strand:- start:57 stop:404 length:348 start_codon:yes stop_codon:yes gene_type:complete